MSLERDRPGLAGAGGSVRKPCQPVCGAHRGSQPRTRASRGPGIERAAPGAPTAYRGGPALRDGRGSRPRRSLPAAGCARPVAVALWSRGN